MIYKLYKENSTKASYLMGTMHSRDERAFAFYDLAMQIMSKCTYYAGEMNLGHVDLYAFQLAFGFQDGSSYKQLIGTMKFNKYRKLIQKWLNFDLIKLNQYKPIYIHSAISEMCLGQDKPLTLDQQLFNNALELGMITTGIETVDEQMKIAKSIDLGLQQLYLKRALKNISSTRKTIQKIASYYAQDNIKKIYELSTKDMPSLKKILVLDRNIIMADRIYEMVDQHNAFITLGAAHLYGNRGVLTLLKKKGLMVLKHYA